MGCVLIVKKLFGKEWMLNALLLTFCGALAVEYITGNIRANPISAEEFLCLMIVSTVIGAVGYILAAIIKGHVWARLHPVGAIPAAFLFKPILFCMFLALMGHYLVEPFGTLACRIYNRRFSRKAEVNG